MEKSNTQTWLQNRIKLAEEVKIRTKLSKNIENYKLESCFMFISG